MQTSSSRSRSKSRAILAAATLALVASSSASGQSSSWASPVSGTFNVPANWINGVPSGAASAVFGQAGGPYTVSFSNSPSNKALQVANGTVTFDLNGNTYSLTNSPGTAMLVGNANSTTASLTITDGTVSSPSSVIGIATTAGIGIVNVTTGGVWNTAANLTLGANTSSGSLTVQNGGDVTSTLGNIGIGSETSGAVTVTGSGSTWVASQNIRVGGAGPGTLSILNGGVVSSALSGNNIGEDAGSVGNVTVQGNGSAWNISGDLNVGGSNVSAGGTGVLTVSTGGTVSATSAGNLRLWPGGTLNLSGGTLSVASFLSLGGRLNFNGGTFGFAGDWTADFDQVLAVLGSDASLGVNSAVRVNGGLNLQTAIVLDGGTLSVNSLTGTGGSNLQLKRGTLNVASNVSLGAGGSLGSAPLTLGPGMNVNLTSGGSTFTVNNAGLLVLDGGNLSSVVVTNNGEIRGESPTSQIAGTTLSNFGLISGSLRFTTSIDNRAAAEMRVSDGERMNFLTAPAAPQNRGKFSLLGGTIESAQLLTNTVTGTITGHGDLIATGGLTNAGSMTFSGGLTDVMGGAVTNQASSKVIVTGGSTSTFYGNVTNVVGSEFRVSTNSTAVFLGNVSGLGAFSGPGTKIFEAGASAAEINSGNGATIVGPAGSLAANFVRDGSLLINGTAQILPGGTAASVSRVGTLTIDAGGGATLDLRDNDLIATASSVSQIETLVRSARNGGAWDLGGITSSTARSHPQAATGLGVLGGAEFHSLYGPTEPFDGFAVAATDVLVKYTWNGDANLNGVVNFDDYVRIDIGFNAVLTGWINGDFNYSGGVNFDDYVLIDVAFNTQSGVLSRAVDYISGDDRSGAGLDDPSVQLVVEHFAKFGVPYGEAFLAAVPEPASVCLSAFGALAGMRRRRRYHKAR